MKVNTTLTFQKKRKKKRSKLIVITAGNDCLRYMYDFIVLHAGERLFTSGIAHMSIGRDSVYCRFNLWQQLVNMTTEITISRFIAIASTALRPLGVQHYRPFLKVAWRAPRVHLLFLLKLIVFSEGINSIPTYIGF